MATSAVPEQPEIEAAKREVRFGLVVYGGVSLAIYIYGVVYEFWRLVRASKGHRNEYSDLLEELGLRATVDIVSGASAGGINGVLLAKALATGAGMDVVRSIWVDEGDILKLLRDPKEQEPRSLLRSERFDELIRAGLEAMDRTGDGEPLVDVVDLFVPATRLRPWMREFQDYSGLVLQTNDFRKVFRLKYRTEGFNPADRELGYNRNDFAHSQNALLAEVARATSAFPFAFEPRLIRKHKPADLRFASEEPEATYFSDGGILDNKPFTEAIEAIYARAAFWPVSRWLVSVEPDPGARASQQDPGPEPEVVEVVGAALLGIPRSENISRDLERLREHRVRVERAEDLLQRIDRLVENVLADADGDGVVELEALLGPLGSSAYESERRRAVGAELVDRLLDCAGLETSARPYVEDGLESYLRQATGNTLDLVDVAFERRRIYYLLSLVERAPSTDAERAAEATVRAHLWAAFERIEEGLWRAFGSDSPTAPALAALSAAGGAAIAEAVEAAVGGVVATLAGTREAAEAEVAAAVTAFDAALPPALGGKRAAAQGRPWHGLVFAFGNYGLWDVFIVVIEHVGGVNERDPIKHRHITPAAATYIRKPTKDKLAGDALAHFGGFLKKSWRLNDILWGRLDAAEVIVRTLLLEHERTLETEEVEERIRRVQEPIARTECQALQERPQADYRLYLEQEYEVGSEDVADVPIQDRAELVVRGADVFRNMVRRLQHATYEPGLKATGLKKLFGALGTILGFVLFFTRWPIRAVFGHDIALRRIATLVLSTAFIWALVTLVLALFDIIPLEVLWGTLGTFVAGAIVIFLLYLLLLGYAVRQGR